MNTHFLACFNGEFFAEARRARAGSLQEQLILVMLVKQAH